MYFLEHASNVEVGPRETRVERVTHPAMPEDIPEPTQEGAVQVIEGVQREQGHRITRVESAFTALTKRVTELERDNKRLRGTASVESQRRVVPLPIQQLAVRHSVNHSSSNSSSRHLLSDHSSPNLPSTSAGSSCKRRRSSMTSVPALPPVSRALSPV
nr:hypothetical protein [Tanacetum cinerariifolium]